MTANDSQRQCRTTVSLTASRTGRAGHMAAAARAAAMVPNDSTHGGGLGGGVELPAVLGLAADLGVGRIVASETEAPNMLVILV